ncbi:MAG: ATP cone domain-containing protein [Patescibacteria group bacterium]|nr:ATP cone domain-containing protein [Patescibacteria group bacterium]
MPPTNKKFIGGPAITKIVKRDGSIVKFDRAHIVAAVSKAMIAGGASKPEWPKLIADAVIDDLKKSHKDERHYIPNVEEVQDTVEKQLILKKFTATAKAYIIYRQKHAELRKQGRHVPDKVKELVHESKNYFSNHLSEFMFYSTYSKWIPEEGRRESWIDTVGRYINFMKENLGKRLKSEEYEEIRGYMLAMKALGSMRLLWSSGPAARKSNVCAYNCSFIAPSKWQDFGEIMYISMCGTGLGFSVEEQSTGLLPIVKRQSGETLPTHVVDDSREGWADSLVLGLKTWSGGKDIDFDYSQVRPAGARLQTMGGRASGPDPLRALHEFARERILSKQGRRLSPINVHDIICKIGEIVVSGGVRRSALISISDLDDPAMREAKTGQFYLTYPERSMANNSAAYNGKPSVAEFLDEWNSLIKSGSGERGIWNRGSLEKQLPKRRWPIFAPDAQTSGVNPCGEIVLKSKQFCNLSEVVARKEDTEESLMNKVRIATILGTYQSRLTKFEYLSKEWKENCEAEALLGVSITGQWDCPTVRNPETLRKLRELAIKVNKEYARRFGVRPSTCITCVKPSGNGSQLFNSSSGMHPRHAPYYIRRVRIESHNPIFKMLRDIGVPHHPEVGQDPENVTTYVLEFPVKAPDKSIFKNDITALEQLEYWKMVKVNYTEHNPSSTISIGEEEWLDVAEWVYKNWDIVGGLSFLPRSNHVYRLAPYEEISYDHYRELMAKFPKIDFAKLVLYEETDNTVGAKELACVSGTCEIDAVPSAPALNTDDPQTSSAQ